MSEIKVNLDLMNALIKLREASVIFDEQTALIAKESGREYMDEQNSFGHGIYECMDAIGKMIGENVVNGVYGLIPDTSYVSR